jgi:hypothetical protein
LDDALKAGSAFADLVCGDLVGDHDLGTGGRGEDHVVKLVEEGAMFDR